MDLRTLPAFLFLLSGSSLEAQTVRIVDATVAGPGALQAAVNISAPGDILRIKPGTYTKTTVTRGLHLLAEPTASCHQLVATGIPAGETLTVVGLDLIGIPGTRNYSPDEPLRVLSCAGKVLFSSASVLGRQDLPQGIPSAASAALVEQSELHAESLVIAGVNGRFSNNFSGPGTFFPGAAVTVRSSRITLTGCTLTGGSGNSSFIPIVQALCSYTRGEPGQPAIDASGTVVVVDRCQLTGGNGGDGGMSGGCQACPPLWSFQTGGSGGNAVLLSGGTLVCMGVSTLRAGPAGHGACGRAPSSSAVDGSALVHLDPAVQIHPDAGAPPIGPGLQVVTRFLPSLAGRTPRVTLGAPAGWTHRDNPGAYVFFLLGGAPTTWIPHPLVLGGVDIDAPRWLVFGPMLVPNLGQVSFGFTVPNDPTLNGARLCLQTVGIDAAFLPAAPPLTAAFVSY
jgi:hypothetical protein